jgi:hypothetical protein
MPAYVDTPRHQRSHGLSGHLIATSLEELHQVAEAIGLHRRYFQAHAMTPHYTLPAGRRDAAIAAGAIAVADDAQWRRIVERVSNGLRYAGKKPRIPATPPKPPPPPAPAPSTVTNEPITLDLFQGAA